MNIFEKIAVGISILGIIAVTQINADDETRTLNVTGAEEDALPWLAAVDTQLSLLDTVRDADTIAVLKQFRRTIDLNKHGKIYGDNLRVALFKLKNTLPALHDQLQSTRNQASSRLLY